VGSVDQFDFVAFVVAGFVVVGLDSVELGFAAVEALAAFEVAVVAAVVEVLIVVDEGCSFELWLKFVAVVVMLVGWKRLRSVPVTWLAFVFAVVVAVVDYVIVAFVLACSAESVFA